MNGQQNLDSSMAASDESDARELMMNDLRSGLVRVSVVEVKPGSAGQKHEVGWLV